MRQKEDKAPGSWSWCTRGREKSRDQAEDRPLDDKDATDDDNDNDNDDDDDVDDSGGGGDESNDFEAEEDQESERRRTRLSGALECIPRMLLGMSAFLMPLQMIWIATLMTRTKLSTAMVVYSSSSDSNSDGMSDSFGEEVTQVFERTEKEKKKKMMMKKKKSVPGKALHAKSLTMAKTKSTEDTHLNDDDVSSVSSFSSEFEDSDDDSDDSDYYSSSDRDSDPESNDTSSTEAEDEKGLDHQHLGGEEDTNRRRSNSEFNPLLASLPTVSATSVSGVKSRGGEAGVDKAAGKTNNSTEPSLAQSSKRAARRLTAFAAQPLKSMMKIGKSSKNMMGGGGSPLGEEGSGGDRPEAFPPTSMKSTGSSNKGLRSYYLHLSQLHAYDLFDTSTIEADPQDPMLLIRWGRYSNGHFVEEGQVRTNRLVDAGTDAKFGEHIRIELNSSDYKALSNSNEIKGNPLKEHAGSQLEFRIEVWNVNFIGAHKHIGEGRLALQSVLNDIDSTATWEVKLLHSPMWPKTPFMMGKVHMRGFLSRARAGDGTTVTSRKVRSTTHKERLEKAGLDSNTRRRQTSGITETTDGSYDLYEGGDVAREASDASSGADTVEEEGSLDSFMIASEKARNRKDRRREAQEEKQQKKEERRRFLQAEKAGEKARGGARTSSFEEAASTNKARDDADGISHAHRHHHHHRHHHDLGSVGEGGMQQWTNGRLSASTVANTKRVMERRHLRATTLLFSD